MCVVWIQGGDDVAGVWVRLCEEAEGERCGGGVGPCAVEACEEGVVGGWGGVGRDGRAGRPRRRRLERRRAETLTHRFKLRRSEQKDV